MADTLTQLAQRVEAGEASNALDVLAEIALFKPCEHWSAIRSNAAGTKVICTSRAGEESTFWAGDYTMPDNRAATAAALRAHAAKGDR